MKRRFHRIDFGKPASRGLSASGSLAITLALCLSACDSARKETTAIAAKPRFEERVELVTRDLNEKSGPDSPGGTMFEQINGASIGLDFVHQWEMRQDTIERLDKLEAGGGVVIGDVDGDRLPDVLLTRPFGGLRLYQNLGNFRFKDISAAAGLGDPSGWPTGAAFGDIDNDGDLDLAVCGFDCPTRIYTNDGSGKFTERAAELGMEFTGAGVMISFSDYDRDGDLDAFLATNRYARNLIDPRLDQGSYISSLIQKEADGSFSLPEAVDELWGLIERPGQSPWIIRTGQRGRLFRNDGGRFTETGEAAGLDDRGLSLSATWWDHNNDGWPDLYVANDFMGADRLYENQKDGTFRDVAPEVLAQTPWYSMGSDVGDINNDGREDFIATDMAGSTHYKSKLAMGDMDKFAWFLESGEPRQYMRNAVYLNTGSGRKMEVAQQLGLSASDWTWSPKFGDFDCDGWLDIFITNGMTGDWFNSDTRRQSALGEKRNKADEPEKRDANMAFRNSGGGLAFEDTGAEWGLNEENVSFGAALADLDLDGDLDIVVNRFREPVGLYRNHAKDGGRVRVELFGRQSNTSGIGATVIVKAGGISQSRTLTLARGVISANEPALHFGLGDAQKIDSLQVRWPSGHRQDFANLALGRIFEITEPAGAPPALEPEPVSRPLFALDSSFPDIRHREADFDDFLNQPLLPNRMSRLGPGVAAGDVDGDGDEDIYIGAASGSTGVLVLREGTAWSIDSRSSGVFSKAEKCEDIGALFFDAEGDGDVDLYVVSGGVESAPTDRLYLNDGSGVFSLADGALPEINESGSCVAAADFDADGDLDLFVGGRVIPDEYPLAPASRLLRNDSSAGLVKFTDITAEHGIGLLESGMVTAAIWSDVDGDGDPDLLVTHEWGPVKLFRNTGGKLEDFTAVSESGWWNGITAGDVDSDGDMDYAVSNFGLNTKYHAAKDKPLAIYYGDFSGDGIKQIIEAKQTDSGLLPVRGFSCSSAAIPGISSKVGYRTPFHNFASKTLEELYSDESLKGARQFHATELRTGLLINDGTGNFTFSPLHPLAQVSPGFGLTFCDADGDAHLDLFIGQNFFSPQAETGRMHGGLSLLLRGDGKGGFDPVWPEPAGIIVPGDAKGMALLSGGEILIAQNNDKALLFTPSVELCTLRLIGKPKNSAAIGAYVRCSINGKLIAGFEISAGNGYLSGSTNAIIVPVGEEHSASRLEVIVRWPDKSETNHEVPAKGISEIRQPPS